MDFGFWYYYTVNELARSPIENFFRNLDIKFSANEHQIELTAKLYQAEYESSKKDAYELYEEAVKKANVEYEIIYTETSGDEDSRQQWAMHASGLNQIEDAYRDWDEPLFNRLIEMKDSFYKSSTILLYAQLETELKKLCDILRKMRGIKIALEHLGGRDYIGASKKYLGLAIELNMDELNIHDNKLAEIQNFRNLLVHDMGIIPLNKEGLMRKVINSNKGSLETENHNEQSIIRIVNEKFIISSYSAIRLYFQDLFWLIECHNGFEILNKRIIHLMGFIDDNVEIKNLHFIPSVNKVLTEIRKRTFSCIAMFKQDLQPYFVHVEIVFKNSETDVVKVYLEKSLHEKEMLRKIYNSLDKKTDLVIHNIFDVFFLNTSGRSIEIKITPKT